MQTLKKNPIPKPSPVDPDPRILIAEDNEINQKLMTMLFQKICLPVHIVANGQEAVNAALSNTYDLVLMDIHMPVMNGFEACSAIKEHLGTKAPAIIALTADTQCDAYSKEMAHRPDHFLTKPLRIDDIKKVINEFTFLGDLS